MATPNLLTTYMQKQAQLNQLANQNRLGGEGLLVMQEVNYRICVLETFRLFSQTAPSTNEMAAITYHYSLVNSYIQFLLAERKFGPKTNQEGQKRRETAYDALCRAVADHRARFSNYRPATPDQFRNDICNVISTVLNLWVSYRDTYINLFEEAKK